MVKIEINLGTISIESQAGPLESVLVRWLYVALDNEPFLSDNFESVMNALKLVLSISPERLLILVNPLGHMLG